MRVGSLFAGIGGIELGLEMASPAFHTVFQVERDPYARAVLAKHWPDALRLEDVRHVNRTTVPGVDLLCGGFPCQPHSVAGRRDASADERDLWGEFARIIGDLGPRWVLAENVPGLLSSRDPVRGAHYPGAFFGRVLSDLDALGYVGEWHCIPAQAVGAPHIRDRVFIVAHAHRAGRQKQHPTALAGGAGLDSRQVGIGGRAWRAEPMPVRVADGVPARLDRIRTLGNAVVPQVARWIGERILAAEEAA